MHQGTVAVSETPGGGATFRVSLPLADPDAEAGTEVDAGAEVDGRALLPTATMS